MYPLEERRTSEIKRQELLTNLTNWSWLAAIQHWVFGASPLETMQTTRELIVVNQVVSLRKRARKKSKRSSKQEHTMPTKNHNNRAHIRKILLYSIVT